MGDDSSPLLDLPDPCLLLVMQCCAHDLRCLFSAARTHSRLHQEAVLAAGSITVSLDSDQATGMLQYLEVHGQHVNSIDLEGVEFSVRSAPASPVILRELPHRNLQKLNSLTLYNLPLQLQPGFGFQGVLQAGAPLKRLQMHHCSLLHGEEALAAALSALPSLQHLSIKSLTKTRKGTRAVIPTEVLKVMQQLTFLELADCALQGSDGLRHLQVLTCLQDLRLGGCAITSTALSGAAQLTRLEIEGGSIIIEPGILSTKTRLQHLQLKYCSMIVGPAGVAQLLAEMQPLQQLTYLSLKHSFGGQQAMAPVEFYSGVTASSKLQHLEVSECILPAGVWQHMLPAGKLLQELQTLTISEVHHPNGPAAAPEGSSLVSCCPGLQSLDMRDLQYSAGLLSSLQGLSGLRELSLSPAEGSTEDLGLVCQLTGLKRLDVVDSGIAEGLFVQLAQLRQLTSLYYNRVGVRPFQFLQCKGPGDELVWRQVLHLNLDHKDPAVAHQAAVTLATEAS